jgi:melibiose permease/lactose/raffinose/galactose permease
MANASIAVESKTFNRNKWLYSLGGIGRDMSYTLVATFFLTYVQYSGLNLSVFQFSVIGILLIIGRVWDAVNDPMMGAIIEGTKFKWGKFKPWILIGALSCAVIIVFMFNLRPSGWNFVIFFGVIYFLWELTFTMNDISYWSMMASLTSEPKQRNSLTTLAVVFAGVGAFTASALIPFFTTGNAKQGYSIISIVIAIIFVGCQVMTSVGVKENKSIVIEKEESISVKKLIRVIKGNDQLLWVTLAMLLYNIGSGLLVALGYNFFYMEIGYDGTQVLIFVATFGVCNIGAQAFYPQLAKKFSRNQLLLISLIIISFGYAVLLITGNVPFLPLTLLTLCIFGVFVFVGQAIFYMILTVDLTNTIEYNEYKTGERNESVVFSLRPFMAKLASALQQGIVTLVLVTTAIYGLSQSVSGLEAQKSVFDEMSIADQQTFVSESIADISQMDAIAEEIDMKQAEYDSGELEGEDKANLEQEITDLTNEWVLLNTISDDSLKIEVTELVNGKKVTTEVAFDEVVITEGNSYALIITDAADTSFKDTATSDMRWGLRITITIIPTILILAAYLVLKKKFIINEEKYDEMSIEIQKKREEIAEKLAKSE